MVKMILHKGVQIVQNAGEPALRELKRFAPLAGPANAGEKIGKLGIWKRVMLNHYLKSRSEL